MSINANKHPLNDYNKGACLTPLAARQGEESVSPYRLLNIGQVLNHTTSMSRKYHYKD